MQLQHQKITLDVNDTRAYTVLNAHQGDSKTRFIDITLTENGNTITLSSNYVATVKASINNKTKAVNTAVVDATKNVITIELTKTMLDTPGLLNCEVVLQDNQQFVTSATFAVKVAESVISDESAIAASQEFGALNEALENAKKIEDNAEVVKDMLERISEVGTLDEIAQSVVDIKKYQQQNFADKINNEKAGYFTSTNQNNQGNFDNGTYSITTSSDNTVRANWIFNSEIVTEKGSYYISFDYKTNSDFNLGVKIDNSYKDLGKIGAIADGNKHTFVAKVDVTSSLNLYEIYVSNIADVNMSIFNIIVMSEFDFVKSYSNITEYLQTHDLAEVTHEQFGAVGNGVFDDTTALQKAIDYCITNGKQLKCQNGKTYCISASLDLSNTSVCLINFNWATLKAIKIMDYMFKFDGSANVENDVKTLLKNIVIDCNNKAGGLNLIYSYKFTFENFMIKNCQTVAIWIQKGGAFVCQNGTIVGDCTPDSRGIYNQTSDCHFNEIVIVDMKKCIYNGGTNFYNKVHGWLTSKVANSIFFDHFAGFGSLVQCQCDTYETGYLLRTSYDLSLVACTYYNNYHLYDSKATPVIFKFNSGIHPYARRICCTNCSFNSPNIQATLSSVTDAQITFNGHTHFINVNGYDTISKISPTLQSKVTDNFDNSVNKLSYRNGLCYYDFSLKFTSAIGASNLLEIATIQSPYYPLESQMFPCYLTKTLAGSDCIVGKILIGTDGKVQVRVPSGSVADYQYLYGHIYYEPKQISD